MNILLEHGNHSLDNLGDLAMLQVAAANVNRLWPNSVIHVPTIHPKRLAHHLPTVRAAPDVPQWALPAAQVAAKLPPAVRARLSGWLRAAAKAWNQRTGTDARAGDMHAHDLILMAGSGIFADPFRGPALARLDRLARAQAAGWATALVSQGLGPMADRQLHTSASAVFHAADLIGLREGLEGPELLRRMIVPAGKIMLAGDDSLELALRAGPPNRPGQALGFNLRLAPHSGLDAAAAAGVVEAVQEFARARATALQPLSVHRSDQARLLKALPGLQGDGLAAGHKHRVDALLAAIARCRLVVAGSYHAAALALGQGIPALCLVQNDYYRYKFGGLADQYPQGCLMIDLRHPGAREQLSAGIGDLWEHAAALQTELLQRTEGHVKRSRAVYQRLKEII